MTAQHLNLTSFVYIGIVYGQSCLAKSMFYNSEKAITELAHAGKTAF